MVAMTKEVLARIVEASKSYAEDGAVSQPRQVVFRAIHEIASRIEEGSRHREDYVGAVECMFRSACRQVLDSACECDSHGIIRCELLVRAGLAGDRLPE